MHQSHKTRNIIIGVIVAVVLIGGGAAAYMALNANDETKQATADAPAGPPKDFKEAPNAPLPTIVFSDQGFSQSAYTFPSNTDIRVDNQSSMDLQFSSDDHPTHKDTPALNMSVLKPGESGTFTPPGKGTYGFHDHINDQYEGTLTIQ